MSITMGDYQASGDKKFFLNGHIVKIIHCQRNVFRYTSETLGTHYIDVLSFYKQADVIPPAPVVTPVTAPVVTPIITPDPVTSITTTAPVVSAMPEIKSFSQAREIYIPKEESWFDKLIKWIKNLFSPK